MTRCLASRCFPAGQASPGGQGFWLPAWGCLLGAALVLALDGGPALAQDVADGDGKDVAGTSTPTAVGSPAEPPDGAPFIAPSPPASVEPSPDDGGLLAHLGDNPFARLQLGLSLPLTGPLGAAGGAGGAVRVALGLDLLESFVGLVELSGVGHPLDPASADDDSPYFSAVGASVGARVLVLPTSAIHVFGDGTVGLWMVALGQGAAPAAADLSPTLGCSASAGVEIDLLPFLSLEGGLRSDFLFTHRLWSGDAGVQGDANTFILTPFVAATIYP